MRLEGRIALGLDEFMLRLGHLKILATILAKTSGSSTRISRQLAEVLTADVQVPSERIPLFGDYLVKKKLCAVASPDGTVREPRAKARYAHIKVMLDESGGVGEVRWRTGTPMVWFQDLAIADAATRSKIGAVTVDTREISNKSGVSHLVDWAVIIGIANRRLGLTSQGGALLKTVKELDARRGAPESSPYVIGPERTAMGWLLFMADGDVLARLVLRLAALPEITKADAMKLAVEICDEMRTQANDPRSRTGAAPARAVRDFQKDIGVGSVFSKRRGKMTSTVWHRMSSRLESLTDIGLLTKRDASGRPREYDYYYRPTEALLEAAAELKQAASPTQWLQERLAQVLSGPGLRDPLPDDRKILLRSLELCLGPTGVHIDSFSVVTASLAGAEKARLSFATAREMLVAAALKHPERIRLSGGYSGARAEFASIVGGKLNEADEALFVF